MGGSMFDGVVDTVGSFIDGIKDGIANRKNRKSQPAKPSSATGMNTGRNTKEKTGKKKTFRLITFGPRGGNPERDEEISQVETISSEEPIIMAPEETDILLLSKKTLLAQDKRKDYGVLLMERAANMGFDEAKERIENDPEVQCALGRIYEAGDYGKEKNLLKAVELYSKAVDSGWHEAMYLLGCLLYEGKGIEKNQYRAVRLWESAAERLSDANKKLEDPEVCRILGESYADEKNWMLAHKWWMKSVEVGGTEAPYHLGVMYRDSIYVNKNLEKALHYFKISAERGYLPAMYQYGRVLLDPDCGDYLPDEGAGLLKGAADRGYPDAECALQEPAVMYWLGRAYEKGVTGIEKDGRKAFEWVEKAVDADYIPAQFRLGCFYCSGTGVDKDDYRGIWWIKVADEAGDKEAHEALARQDYRFLLAKAYLEDIKPFTKNDREGERILYELSEEGYPPAKVMLGKSCLYHDDDSALKGAALLLEAGDSEEAKVLLESARGKAVLGEMYLNGYPSSRIEKDEKQAEQLLTRAANWEDARGQFLLGLLLYERGIQRENRNDIHWAVSWWERAAGQGWHQAQEKLEAAENQFYLGEAYELGRGGQFKDITKALQWYQKAANQQLAKAQYVLGGIYYQGGPVVRDIEKAAGLWMNACQREDRYRHQLAKTGIPERLGKELFQRGRYEAAVPWLDILVDQNDAEAMYDYGWILDAGKAGTKEPFKAALLWEESARLKYQKAQEALQNPEILYRLGIVYYQGKSNVLKDDEKAKRYLTLASESGHEKAREDLKTYFPPSRKWLFIIISLFIIAIIVGGWIFWLSKDKPLKIQEKPSLTDTRNPINTSPIESPESLKEKLKSLQEEGKRANIRYLSVWKRIPPKIQMNLRGWIATEVKKIDMGCREKAKGNPLDSIKWKIEYKECSIKGENNLIDTLLTSINSAA